MPILKYKCGDCGKEFAKIFFRPENAPRECPVCGGTNLTEEGEAFDSSNMSLARAACISCDTCESEAGCDLSPST